MRRFTRRRYRRSIAGPYSREGTRYVVVAPQTQGMWENYTTVVPPIETQGNRKVKNILMSIGVRSLDYPIVYTVYYLPQNAEPNTFLAPTVSYWNTGTRTWVNNWSSTYEPNQNVLCTGILSKETPARVYWSGLRTLNSGDRIVLALHNIFADAQADPHGAVLVDIRYSIAYS